MFAVMDQQETIPPEAVTFTEAEIAAVEAARADYRARGGIPFEETTAWLDSLDTSNPLPKPQPRKG